jgi:hypothetical protein
MTGRTTVSNFDTEPATPSRAAPSLAFDRAMTAVEARCTYLTSLLDGAHLTRIEQVARSAAHLWLTGRSALRRQIERDRTPSPHVAEARQRMDETYARLLAVIRRAYSKAPDLSTRSQLDTLWIDLVTATAKPIDDAAPAVGARSADDTEETDINA